MKKDNLEICKKTRKIAAESLCKTLNKVLKQNTPVSEVDFRNLWLKELRKHQEIFPDGWYTPPPHGIGVLFGTEENVERINYKSLRPQENWPKKNILLDQKKGLAYLFAGPVDKKIGIIGDFGVTIYFGKNKKIINHLITCYKLTKKIFDHSKTGMRFSDIAKYSFKLCKEKNLINTIESSTDPTGTNIGHTIPSTDTNCTNTDNKIFKNESWEKICKLISNKRIFLNETQQTILKKGMAITIEPRPRSLVDPIIPMVSFHTIGLFHENGEKELLTNFDEIFKLANMTYMLPDTL